jgi:uncharacterized protein (DUF2141 family)
MNLRHFVTALAAPLALLCAGPGNAQSCQGQPSANRLDIDIEGVRSSHGLITGSLYPGEASQFLVKDGAIRVWSVPATSPTTRMCIWLKWGPGTYAFAVYHDPDSSGHFHHNLLGRFDGYGFSNNPRAIFSVPKYDQVKFEATGPQTILHVRLRYP